jgi:uncharacterized membrane protein
MNFAVIVVLLSQVLAALGAFFLKKGSNNLHRNIKSFIFNKFLLFGLIIYAISAAMFIPALKYGELSVLYPLVSTTYIWATLLSVVYLKEKLNKFKIIGFIFIMLGVALIGFSA